MRGILVIMFAAAVHSLASLVCGIGEFMVGGALDRLASQSSPLFTSLKHVLEFPLITLLALKDSPMHVFALPVMIVNSFLWGVALYLVLAFINKYMLAGKPN